MKTIPSPKHEKSPESCFKSPEQKQVLPIRTKQITSSPKTTVAKSTSNEQTVCTSRTQLSPSSRRVFEPSSFIGEEASVAESNGKSPNSLETRFARVVAPSQSKSSALIRGSSELSSTPIGRSSAFSHISEQQSLCPAISQSSFRLQQKQTSFTNMGPGRNEPGSSCFTSGESSMAKQIREQLSQRSSSIQSITSSSTVSSQQSTTSSSSPPHKQHEYFGSCFETSVEKASHSITIRDSGEYGKSSSSQESSSIGASSHDALFFKDERLSNSRQLFHAGCGNSKESLVGGSSLPKCPPDSIQEPVKRSSQATIIAEPIHKQNECSLQPGDGQIPESGEAATPSGDAKWSSERSFQASPLGQVVEAHVRPSKLGGTYDGVTAAEGAQKSSSGDTVRFGPRGRLCPSSPQVFATNSEKMGGDGEEGFPGDRSPRQVDQTRGMLLSPTKENAKRILAIDKSAVHRICSGQVRQPIAICYRIEINYILP